MWAFAIAVPVVAAVWLLSDVLLLVFAAVLIAIGLRALAATLNRWTGLPIRPCIALICGITILGLASSIWLWGMDLANAAGQLFDLLKEDFASLRQKIEATSWGSALIDDVSASQLFSAGRSMGGNIAGMAFSTFGLFGTCLITIATAIYLALDPWSYMKGCIRLVPTGYRSRSKDILLELHHALSLWLLGRLIDMGAVFAMTYAGLWALDSPAALSLAMLAAILNFVPYIGAIAGAAPAILVGLSSSLMDAVYIAVLFTVVQMVEGYVLSPAIQKQTVSLPPAVTILSQTVFGTLFGAFGLVLAPALAVALMIAVRMAYVEDVLEAPPTPH
jgi:predicted PurR-regulated permease PerM